MNSRTAKLLNKIARKRAKKGNKKDVNRRRKQLKKIWNDTPRPARGNLRLLLEVAGE